MTAPAIWMQSARGQAIDLLNPVITREDLLGDIPDALARISRYGGHVPGGCYSVAQHLVMGADCIQAQRCGAALARAFILHDAHEYGIGDIITPAADALAAHVGAVVVERFSFAEKEARLIGEGLFKSALARFKGSLDAAIYRAAGHPWPLEPALAAQVAEWDLRMLQAERRQLLMEPPYPWSVPEIEPAPLRGKITIWPWPDAADRWRGLLLQLFPHLA